MPGKDVKATLHVAVPPVPERVQVVELKVPGPLLLQLTVPVGVIGVPGDVSVTVAVHVVECKSWIVLGEQLRLVEVVRSVVALGTSTIPISSKLAIVERVAGNLVGEVTVALVAYSDPE
ncbi:MAG: hypothetical protein E6K99_03905 [Thaumarchaeota archaeon]|nr:MAG: hypothetical protein E6K99_03905 [Nitrososphaerota archaeon]